MGRKQPPYMKCSCGIQSDRCCYELFLKYSGRCVSCTLPAGTGTCTGYRTKPTDHILQYCYRCTEFRHLSIFFRRKSDHRFLHYRRRTESYVPQIIIRSSSDQCDICSCFQRCIIFYIIIILNPFIFNYLSDI